MNLDISYGFELFIFENFILMKGLKNAFLNYVKTESIGRKQKGKFQLIGSALVEN